MGNHKFRLLPKSWLLTLKNITIKSTPPKKTTPPKTKTKVIPQPTPRRQSYYIPSNNNNNNNSDKTKATDTKYHHFDPPRKISTRPKHVNTMSSSDLDDVFSGLPPISTKPRPKDTTPRAIRTGVKVKVRSTATTTPRVSRTRRSITGGGFAVVTRSDDPQRDFRESMVEMIVENNMASAKELEDLLACYLTLNSEEYHGVIVKVFEQIWFDLRNIRRRCRGNGCVASSGAGRVN